MKTDNLSNADYARYMRQRRGAGIARGETDIDEILDDIRFLVFLKDRSTIQGKPEATDYSEIVAMWGIHVGVRKGHPWYMRSAKAIGHEDFVVRIHDDRWWFMWSKTCKRTEAVSIAISIATQARDAVPKPSSEGIATRATE